MSTSITIYSAYPLGRWLAAMAIGLVLLALAYAQAPDLTGQFGLSSPSARLLANNRPVLEGRRSHCLAPSQAPVFASASLCLPTGAAPHTSLTQ